MRWAEAFGRLYADVQIHASQRGFLHAISKSGVELLRYRVEWRAMCSDKLIPRRYGATHIIDKYIWWYADGDATGLSEEEQKIVQEAFLNDLGKFIGGEKVNWSLQNIMDVRRLKENGEIEVWKDELWEDGVRKWNRISRASAVVEQAKI